jgi:hypothetical protein
LQTKLIQIVYQITDLDTLLNSASKEEISEQFLGDLCQFGG